MKKFYFISISLFFFSTLTIAQAYEKSIEYDKKKQPAFVIEYSYPPEAVENAIIQRMEKLGYKGKEEKGLFNKDKGFRIYKNAFITEITAKKFDYLILVERKSRRDQDESVLYMIIHKDGENAVSGFDADEMTQAKGFLNALLPEVETANLELQIKAQEEVISKAEKKYKNLQSEKTDMENKIKKLEDDIEKNKKEQEDTEKDITNQRELLENLKMKRRN